MATPTVSPIPPIIRLRPVSPIIILRNKPNSASFGLKSLSMSQLFLSLTLLPLGDQIPEVHFCLRCHTVVLGQPSVVVSGQRISASLHEDSDSLQISPRCSVVQACASHFIHCPDVCMIGKQDL